MGPNRGDVLNIRLVFLTIHRLLTCRGVSTSGIQIIIRILLIVNKKRAHLYYQNFARTSNLSLKSIKKAPVLLHPGVLIFIHEINNIFVGLWQPMRIYL